MDTIQIVSYILSGVHTTCNNTIQDVTNMRIDFQPLSSESTIIFDYSFSMGVLKNNKRQTGRWGFWLKDYTHDRIIDANDYKKNKNNSFISSVVTPNITPQHITEAHFPGWETRPRFIYTSTDTIKRTIGLAIRNDSGSFTNPTQTKDNDDLFAVKNDDYEVFIGPTDEWNKWFMVNPCPTTCVVKEIL